MCWERDAESKALRSYLSELDAEEWDRQRIEAGEPHPCADCDRYCSGNCKFFGVKGTYKPSFNSNLHPFIAGIFKQHFGI
jgi:hypothetical protein